LTVTPAFKITNAGQDITATYAARLLGLSITDEATEQADSCTIDLANGDGRIIIPESGAVLEISLGYVGNLRNMGQFVIDEVRLSGPPDVLTISGKAAPFTSAGGLKPFQTRKTRSFDNITLGDLVRTLAADAGLAPAIAPDLAAVQIEHIDQTSESDMNLLTRLARSYGALMKPTASSLVFVRRGQSRSATGQKLGAVTLNKSECSGYEIQLGQRQNVTKVRTRRHDTQTGEEVETEAFDDQGSEEEGAEYETPFPVATEEEATRSADAIRDQLARGAQTVRVTTYGRPDLIAEGSIILAGFPAPLNGEWLVKTVSHSLDKSGGYVTEIEGENSQARALAQKEERQKKAKASSGSSGGDEGGAFEE
jgi:phage protein D